MDVIDKMFSSGGGPESASVLVNHQIDSYNEFLDKKLTQIIQGFNPIQICQKFQPATAGAPVGVVSGSGNAGGTSAIGGDFAQKISVSVINPSLSKPSFQTQDGTQLIMTPHLARINNLTYASPLHVDIHVVCEEKNDDGVIERTESSIHGVCLGKIPIMVKSKACVLQTMPGVAEGEGKKECRYDPGGYFIVNGNEKVVICQDRISENKTHVFSGGADGMSAEIRSMQDGVFLPPKTTMINLSGKPNHMGRVMKLNTSFLRSEVPLFVMFRALGVESDRDIFQHIVLGMDRPENTKLITELYASAEDAADIHTQEAALTHLLRLLGITGTPREYLENPVQARGVLLNVMKNDFLPHVGPSFRKKALYIGYMTRKLLNIHLGYQPCDNRDSCMNKRIDTTGVLFGNLFRQCYGKMIKEMRNMVQRELHLWRANQQLATSVISPSNVHRFFKQTTLESGLRYALSTGNWGVKTLGSYNNIRQGVAQVLNRMSYLSTLSHLRRINTPMEKNGKLVQPRKLDITQFGMICPAETPEGGSVGLVKNMAMSTMITTSMSSAYLRTCVEDLGVSLYNESVPDTRVFLQKMGSPESAQVLINGDLIGFHSDPATLYAALKALKRRGDIPPPTSVVWDIKYSTITMSTEAGRMCRPLLIVDGGTSLRTDAMAGLAHKTFKECVAPLASGGEAGEEGFIEYLDVDEVDKSIIAMMPKDLVRGTKGVSLQSRYTHCEIHPCLMNGVLAANIPFSDHNQAPRNCYQCLDINEPVLMATGERRPIKDVREGDLVITFDPKTLYPSVTKVVHQYIRETDKKMYKITTISGRTIVATEDHKFMTSEGWVETQHLDGRTKMGVHIEPVYMEHGEGGDAGGFHLPIMARMVGYLVNHGTLSKNDALRVTFESAIDARLFEDDVERIGFPREDIVAVDDGGRQVTHTGFLVNTLKMMLVKDGVVPEWILEGSAMVKREFVAGFGGPDGCQRIVMEEAMVGFIRQIRDLYIELGVAVSYDALLPDSEDIFFRSYFERIGHRYSTARMLRHAAAVEFIRYKEFTAAGGGVGGGLDGGLEGTEFLNKNPFIKMKTAGGSLFVPILSVVETEVPGRLISDITVESSNHSFIAGHGNFTSSNSAMGKQAVGLYMSNYNQRLDTLGHILNYSQKPLARTHLSKFTHSEFLPSGINAVVAIMTYTGFNQEDSVMINQSAFDRGLFSSTYYKTYRDQCNKNHSTGEEEEFRRPDAPVTSGVKPFNYDKLGTDGFVPVNTAVDGNDILVGKVMPHVVQGHNMPRDTSMHIKCNEHGVVDVNYQGINADGYKFCKVRLREHRIPEVGDKFASRSAQKGSLGMTYRQADMPFTKDGIVPDIIINPHAIPSRMTMGQLLECVMGKAACCLGALGDATPFNGCGVEDIAKVLDGYGMERYGNEILYDGRSGEQIRTEIFIGPTFYQRLKHQVQDKVHSRSNGPVVLLTRQPAEGRARNGGLRFGEMEKDCMCANGTAAFIKERMLDVSDNYRFFVCKKCGMLATANPEKNIYKCNTCKNTADFAQVRAPFACKLLFQELETMSIAPRIIL